MSDVQRRPGHLRAWLAALACAGLLGAAGVMVFSNASGPWHSDLGPPAEVADVSNQVHQFCGACHAYPPPDVFSREHWEAEVRRGFEFFRQSSLSIPEPPADAVIRYYQERAPLELPPADIRYATTPAPVTFEPMSWPGPPKMPVFATSNVNLVHLHDDKRLDILVCDMYSGAVMALRPYEPSPKWQVLATLTSPAHTEVVDLDGDGIRDILVAELGHAQPTDLRWGKVIWLRGNKDGSFTPHTLLENVGRVADVQAADFRGVGKLDLVVAEFGMYQTGSILLLENQTTDWSRPKFVPHRIDERHGAIHVPIIDLNGDGKPDFIALISQEHEVIVAFLNEGNGKFRKQTIYQAPQPAYGSSGIQLVDMNGDGHVDVLFSNGDTLDRRPLLRPYHGIQWLENPGDGAFPWKRHAIAPMYGVLRAVAADVDGDGDMDVVAVSCLPKGDFPNREERKLDAVILLEQTAPNEFVRPVLKAGACDHVSCALGDVTGSGLPDLVVGHFGIGGGPVTVGRNLGKPKK
jgi:hypothetical protein